ncbi:hypothetical protein TREPR_2119 [Treponema primitia ZAS-2]|uniref:Uncharacterized protein n=1 Tax=Treponema primitia (strain ATCC BAA-887 / DSM 12427 / ZAS-2) TaxID=545694 RepID=F5YJ75_TREPZ|nr:hypothetical protein [Treponema primitia]AEF85992.1 hypothetical protein TREPR_2119 [Treponema primitia ZAS-2]
MLQLEDDPFFDGFEQGRIEGYEDGVISVYDEFELKFQEIARQFHRCGLDIDQIMSITGLEEEEVEEALEAV